MGFARFCAVLERNGWASDARYATNPARVAHRDELVPQIAALTIARPVAAWVEALLAVGVPCGPVNDIPAALADPHTVARGMLQEITDASGETLRLIGPAPKLSVTPASVRLAPPQLGEQSEALLHELLGYDAARVAELRAVGAV